MKVRAKLTAAEVNELLELLERRLAAVGMETQPEVARRILDLNTSKNAGLGDYAKVIRADAALSGRLLRTVNSAFFAQRTPVTTLDRACVLLGLERLKSLALGFYLSHGAAHGGDKEFTRTVWGQSVFRACLCAELARTMDPGAASEAFVVGLMLDAGQPLMLRFEPVAYRAVLVAGGTPHKTFHAELETLPYTHVDIAAALCRRWRLPAVLAKPIERHHAFPPEFAKSERAPERLLTLQRAAFYAGSVTLDPITGRPVHTVPNPALGQRASGATRDELAEVVRRACDEYRAVSGMFSAVAAGLDNLDDLAAQAHNQLTSAMEDRLSRSLDREFETAAARVELGEASVELHREPDGYAVAYRFDSQGRRLVAYRFALGEASARSVADALGIEQPEQALEPLSRHLRDLAA